MLKLLEALKSAQIISELNYQFACLIEQKQRDLGYSAQQQNLALLLAALVSYHTQQDNTALHLASEAARNPFGLQGRKLERDFAHDILQKIDFSTPADWATILADHIAFSQMPERIAPMLFQHDLLYFYRYWQAEQRIADYFQRAATTALTHDVQTTQTILSALFAPQTETDWQQVAVATAMAKRFCLISGGPGTGKTRTVTLLLAALQLRQQHHRQPLLNIALAAPTGKAAARLKESLSASLAQLPCSDTIKSAIPTDAATLHSLLGMRPLSDTPKYHQHNPLHYDVLVVDEASMIDLALMEKLLNALRPSTQLILLGDKDQLASVEAGAIMGELGQFLALNYSAAHSEYLRQVTGYAINPTAPQVPAICDTLCHLKRSYRFDQHSGIGKLAYAINHQQASSSWQILSDSRAADLTLNAYPPASAFLDNASRLQACVNQITQQAVVLYRDYLTLAKQRQQDPLSVSISEIFAAFHRVRILTALRISPLGAEQLNQSIAEALHKARLVEFKQSRESYLGKPILLTENAAHLHIYSGDIGLMLPDETGALRLYFDTLTPSGYLNLSPSKVPRFEPAYVMTVHKSQGSEFEHTLLVLPLTPAPILSKELLYTAVTRAKQHFTLFGEEKIWKNAVKTQIQRQSGLKQQLLALNKRV